MCSVDSEQDLANERGDRGVLAEEATGYGGALEGCKGADKWRDGTIFPLLKKFSRKVDSLFYAWLLRMITLVIETMETAF